jgi:hypothetical protein
MASAEFLSPRRCLLEPIQEIFDAAQLLDAAADAHIASEAHLATDLIVKADIPAIAAWTNSIWGTRSANIHRFRPMLAPPPLLSKKERPLPRMPELVIKREVVKRDGYHCRFCGIPVIDEKVRRVLHGAYPNALRWGPTNAGQHSAFQCMWL